MNKYQSALTNLHNRAMRGGDRDGKIIKQTKLLQELVDKATPKKPINKTVEKTGKHAVEKWARGYYDTIDHIVCPHCGKRLKVNGKPHCDKCGGALDWSE